MKILDQPAKTISPFSVAGLLIVGIWALVSFVDMFRGFGITLFDKLFFAYFPAGKVLFVWLPNFVVDFLYFWSFSPDENFGFLSLVVLPLSVAVCILGLVTLQVRFRIAAAAFGGLQLISVSFSNYGFFGAVGSGGPFQFGDLFLIALLPSIGALLLVVGEIIARQKSTTLGAPLGGMTSTTMTYAQNTTTAIVEEISTVIYCGQCGKQNPATARFCNGCGAALVV